MKLKRTHLISRITNLIGLVVLLSLVVFSIWAATTIQQTSSAVKLSTSVSSTYQRILYILAEEETLQYEYMLNPSSALRDEHLMKATTLTELVQTLQQDSDTYDDVIGQHILTQQASYLFYTGQVFSAIDAKDYARARTIRFNEVNP